MKLRHRRNQETLLFVSKFYYINKLGINVRSLYFGSL